MDGTAYEPARENARARAATSGDTSALVALFVTGFGTFLNLYATQPLLPEFRRLFQVSEAMVSLTVSAPVLAVALSAPLIGMLADGLERKRVIVTAMFALMASTALAGTSSGLGQLIFWRFIQGLCIPGIIAVVIAYIGEEWSGKSVGSIMSIYVTGTVVGGFAGRFAAGLVETRWGWRASFLVLGLMTLAAAIATWRMLPRSNRIARRSAAASAFGAMLSHLKNPRLLATYAVGFNVLFCLVGAFTYVNFYLANEPFLLGSTALGSIFGVYLIGAVITPSAGRLLDRIGYRRGLMWAVGVSATGMLLTTIHSLPAVVAGLALESFGVFVCQSASSSQVGKVAEGALSSAAGLYVALYYFGGSVGSIVPGFLWEHAGWPGCVGLIVFMQVVTVLIAGRLWKD